MEDVQLSPNFKLSQFTKSNTATRHNIQEQYSPPEKVITKLKALCNNFMEPMLAEIKRRYPNAVHSLTSGYRCPAVDKLVGGAGGQHPEGEAADNELKFGNEERNLLLAQLILEANIPFDQMILEYGTLERPEWIHTSWDLDKEKQRGVILRIGYTVDPTDKTKQIRQVYQMTRNSVLNLRIK